METRSSGQLRPRQRANRARAPPGGALVCLPRTCPPGTLRRARR